MISRSGFILAVLALTVLAGCSRPAPVDVSVNDPGRTKLEVTIQDGYHFNPPALTLKAGQPVAIVVYNKQAIIHDFTVDKIPVKDLQVTSSYPAQKPTGDQVLHLALPPAGAGKLEFTPTETGSFAFYCSVPGHKEAGMQGTLTVQ